MPTASQIARQAGFSVRSIFERFSVLRALILATADYAIAQGQSEAVARNLMATGRFAFSPVIDQPRELGSDAPQVRPFYGGRASVWRSAIDRMLPSAG